MIELPNPKSSAAIADWIELYLALYERTISKYEVASNIEQASGTEPSEDLLSNIWVELNGRQKKYQKELFNVTNKAVEPGNYSGSRDEYIACLIFSIWGGLDESEIGPELFERLSAEAIKKYINGQVFIFARPHLTPNPDQKAIAERVRSACDCIHERFAESPRSKYRDRGVDLIAWIPFIEGRSGHCVILAQCVSGLNWKRHEPLPFDSWTQYIHWGHDPTKAFVVPCIIPDVEWHDTSRERGILFDRIRIMNLIENGVENKDLKAELKSWTKQKVREKSI